MATKKKGNLTTSSEWANHLRPLTKRWFWKGERNAAIEYVKAETGSNFIQSVEELLLDIDSWDIGKDHQLLCVESQLVYEGNAIQSDVGMSIVLDKVLEMGYFPEGVKKQQHGTIYFYTRESVTNA